jgi:hypothetical protein
MRNPKAGPTTYLLLRGEGKQEDEASPAGSASFLLATVLYSPANACSYRLAAMMLAGTPVRDQDVLELAGLLRDAGFDDTAERLENAYDLETKVLALTIAEREQILRALEDCPDGLAELRGVLTAEHTGRVRDGLV